MSTWQYQQFCRVKVPIIVSKRCYNRLRHYVGMQLIDTVAITNSAAIIFSL